MLKQYTAYKRRCIKSFTTKIHSLLSIEGIKTLLEDFAIPSQLIMKQHSCSQRSFFLLLA